MQNARAIRWQGFNLKIWITNKIIQGFKLLQHMQGMVVLKEAIKLFELLEYVGINPEEKETIKLFEQMEYMGINTNAGYARNGYSTNCSTSFLLYLSSLFTLFPSNLRHVVAFNTSIVNFDSKPSNTTLPLFHIWSNY